MSSSSPSILIADDEEEFRAAFISKHGGSGLAIEQLTDVFSLPENLAARKHLPDLVIVDLYRTKAEPGSLQAYAGNAEVDAILAKLDMATTELRAVVEKVKTPAAIKVLREIRSIPRLQDLPVLIYTRQGLSILSDEDLRDAVHMNAEWMLKGRSAAVEREQMTSFLRHSQMQRRRVKRDVALTIAGAFLGVAIGAVWQWLT